MRLFALFLLLFGTSLSLPGVAAIPGLSLDLCAKSPQHYGLKPLMELTRSDDGYDYRFYVIAVHSQSETTGSGFCGAGEEVSFHICGGLKFKRQILSIPIESCLESIELEGASYGNESPRTLARAIHWDEDPIEMEWLSFKGQRSIKGAIRLVKGKAIYTGPEAK